MGDTRVNMKERYARNHKERARQCKEQAGWKCTKCGAEQFSTRYSKWTGNPYLVYLQAAHVNHDQSNPNAVLVCVCASCHWKHYRRENSRLDQVEIERMKHQSLISLAFCL